MSSLVVACPLCAAPLGVPPELAGQAIACPVCRGQIRLPGAPANSAPADAAMPGDLSAVITPNAHRPRAPARRSGLPLGVILAWVATMGLVVLAGVMIWRERSARLARVEFGPASPVPPSATEAKPKLQPKENETPPPETPAENKPPPDEPQPKAPPPKAKPAPSPKPVTPKIRPAPAAPAVSQTDVWPLPPLIATSPVVLETLAADPSESCELTLRSAAANLSAKAAIFAEAAAGSSAWTVWYVADLDAPQGKVPLATIRREGRELTLAWTQPFADADIRRQLANCQVQWRDAAGTRFIQFREKLSQSRLAVDLSDDRQTVEFPLNDLPNTDHLRLEIRDLARFPEGTAIRGDVKTLTVGKLAVVEFAEMPGAEIELRLLRQSASGNLVLRVEPVFKEKKIREYALSRKNLNQVETKVKHSRDEDREKLGQAQANLQAAQRNLATIKSNPPPSESTPLQRTLHAKAMGAALTRISEQDGKIRQLQEQIQRADERLKAVPKMRAFIQSIHGKASLSYMLVAESGERDIVLVDGTRPL